MNKEPNTIANEKASADSLKSRKILPGCVLALIMLVLSFWIYTRHNQFAFFYHSDESAKVEQVITRQYNFHHPMLLLSTTELLYGEAGDVKSPTEQQRVVETGRLVSAIFTAIAVEALTLLAFLRAGWLAAIATGLLLTFNQQLFELAHYMKEDPALLLGVALSFLTLALYEKKRIWGAALCCGLACGVAVSGKYMGAMMFGCALPVFIFGGALTPGRRALHISLLLLGALLVFALVNLPLLRDLETFRASFSREMDLVAHGSKDMARSVPHTVYLSIFRQNTTPAIWLLLGVFYFQFWKTRRTQSAASWALALFPIVLTLVFSFSPKTNDRYYLPVTAVIYYLSALGLVDLVKTILPHWKSELEMRWKQTGAAVILVALLCEAPKFYDVFHAFQHDDRHELAGFIQEKLPPGARIAQDERVMLPDERNRKRGRIVLDLKQKAISGKTYAANLGTLDALRAKGYTHVAVSHSNYGRFFLDSLDVKDEKREEVERQRAFYEQLFAEGELLFERERGTVIYLHPGLRLYSILQR